MATKYYMLGCDGPDYGTSDNYLLLHKNFDGDFKKLCKKLYKKHSKSVYSSFTTFKVCRDLTENYGFVSIDDIVDDKIYFNDPDEI